MSITEANGFYLHRFDFNDVYPEGIIDVHDVITKKIAAFIKEIDFGQECIDLACKGSYYASAGPALGHTMIKHEGVVLLANKRLTDEQIKKLFEHITSSSPKLRMPTPKFEIRKIDNPCIQGSETRAIPITKFPIPMLTPGPICGEGLKAWTQSFSTKSSFEWLQQHAPTDCRSYVLTDSQGQSVHSFRGNCYRYSPMYSPAYRD